MTIKYHTGVPKLRSGGLRPWSIGAPPAIDKLLEFTGRYVPSKCSSLDTVFDFILVINLDRDCDRMRFQCRQAERLGFSFIRYPAIYGKEVNAAMVGGDLVEPDTVQRILQKNPGGLGHGLTYIEILQMVARSQCRRVLILEDDAEFLPEAKNILPMCLNELPTDFDLLTIGFQVWSQQGVLYDWQPHSSRLVGHAVSSHLLVPAGGFQSTAWVLSPRGAAAILEQVLPWKDEIDYVAYRRFLLSKGFCDDYPTIGSFDLFVQMIFCKLNVYHAHANGQNLIRESSRFSSAIDAQGRAL